MKVKAIRNGYFGHLRRREGDVFTIPDEPRRKPGDREMRIAEDGMKLVIDKNGTIPAAYSGIWMRPVSQNAPERVSTAQGAINKRHDELRQEKAASKAPDEGSGGTGSRDVI